MQESKLGVKTMADNAFFDRSDIKKLLNDYSRALDMLDDYDHDALKKPKGSQGGIALPPQEAKAVIEEMRFGSESDLFGKEKDDSFKGSLGNIFQTYLGSELYPTFEEKAANLFYFLVKNHSFLDGNKRIAAAVFLYFLSKNGRLYSGGKKLISNETVVAMTLMVASSRPEEKELMISVIMNFLA